MKVIALDLPEVKLIEGSKIYDDRRGWFQEIYHRKAYGEVGIPPDSDFVQDNISFSRPGVLRGLHFQKPHPQGKLVKVVSGVIWDVAVDIRRESPNFLKWCAQTLDSRHQLWIPPGFAHGFVAFEESIVFYKCTAHYWPGCEHTIRYDEPKIGIKWPRYISPMLSKKDAEASALNEEALF